MTSATLLDLERQAKPGVFLIMDSRRAGSVLSHKRLVVVAVRWELLKRLGQHLAVFWMERRDGEESTVGGERGRDAIVPKVDRLGRMLRGV